MKQTEDNISTNLKKLRERNSLTLDKLSEITGVSKSMLRQIEIKKSNPTISTIWKIANGLKIPFTSLLEGDRNEVKIGNFKEELPLKGETEGYRLFPIIPFSPEKAFEIYYVEIDKNTQLNAESHGGNAEESVFILEGELTIAVSDEEHSIKANEYITFNANQSHRYQNQKEEMVAALMVISYMAY
ncbi:MAG: XRE family transcriptional regulator [Spirochaetales bacterium]|nr:XRE family transcriptional regulator [Spirochaetales bacterium]